MCWVFVTVWGFSSCSKWGLPSSCDAQASHCCGFSCREVWAQLLRHMGLLPRGMWNPSGPRIEPISPALAGGFLTAGPPGKPWHVISGNVLAMVFSGLNPESRLDRKQFIRSMPSVDLLGYFLFIISLLFVPANFALIVSR